MAFEVPVHTIQPSFARGEVSPYLFGRVDLAGWAQGLRTLRNFTVRPEGAVSNRQGLHFLGNALTNTSKGSVLLPFIFSATQSYVIEIGNLTAQIFSQGAVVTGPFGAAITNVQDGLVGGLPRRTITTGTAHGLVLNQNVTITGVVATGTFQVNGTWQVLGIQSATVFYIIGSGDPNGAYTSGGNIVAPGSFVTPWALTDLPLLRWSQSADTLTVVHPKYPPYEIKRTSATTFTCLPAVYVNGPFLPQNVDGITFVYANAKSGTVQLTANSPIFNANHVGALFQLTQQDLSNIQPWEPSKQVNGTGPAAAAGLYRRASLKNYLSTSSVNQGGTNQMTTGTWLPSHSQGTQADGDGNNVPNLGFGGINWEYQDSGSGIVLITTFNSTTQVTGVVQPNYPGGPGLLPTSVVGGPVTAVGPWTFSGTGAQTSFALTTPNNTSADPTKFIVTINGVYQAPSLYSISSQPGGNIVFVSAPPTGTNNIVVKQISAFGQTSFWAFGAFSADQGYPSAVSYFPDRLILAATQQQPVGVFGSKTSQYHDFGVSNPVVASDAFTVFLNARQLNAISDLIPLSDLLVGTSNIIWRLWPGSTGTALSPLAISAKPQSYYGQSPNCASVLFGDSGIFPTFDGRRLRDLIYQFAFDKFLGQEITLYSRHLIPFGTQFRRLAYKPDSIGELVFGLRSDGQLPVCTYLREQQVIGWGHWDTLGTFEDICIVPETTGVAGNGFTLYALVNRTINGAAVRYVEVLESREVSTIYDYQFLDCNLTYDGRNTSATTMTVSGLTTALAGDTGTLTASGTSGWANFFSNDVTNNNEIWLFQTFNFVSSVGGQQGGTLLSAVAAGTYILTFSDGESRSVTVASDGLTCTWQQALGTAVIPSATCRCRLLITAFTSSTVVSVRLRDPCPAGLQNIATAVWTFARTKFSGANQLANTAVVAYIDANVAGIKAADFIANGSLTVSAGGTLTLPNAGGVVTIGLPYLCDFETLPLNLQGQETIRMRAKTEPVIYLDVTETRNFLAGTDFSTLFPNAERTFEPYVSPTAMQAGIMWTRVASELSSECHTCIRQNMPLPITIRAVIPQITIGEPVS